MVIKVIIHNHTIHKEECALGPHNLHYIATLLRSRSEQVAEQHPGFIWLSVVLQHEAIKPSYSQYEHTWWQIQRCSWWEHWKTLQVLMCCSIVYFFRYHLGWGDSECLPSKPKEIHPWYQDDLQWDQKEKGKTGSYSVFKRCHLLISHIQLWTEVMRCFYIK